jgi:hypothetical protein
MDLRRLDIDNGRNKQGYIAKTEGTMLGLGKILALGFVVVLASSALAASGSPAAGSWRKLPAAPAAVLPGSSVWTGRQLIVVGNVPFKTRAVAEAYDPAANAWSVLPVPRSLHELGYTDIWTGKEVLVWGASHSFAFNPATKHWRALGGSIPGGTIVWTGREAIGWGGGCCGDAQADGVAYNPSTGAFRELAPSPLAPSQRPLGTWTGRELILFVSGFDPDGHRWPARFARAAAYNPLTNTWRRLAPLPAAGLRWAGNAAWDGHEVLVAGAGANARLALAFNPRTNRWRRLASLPAGRIRASAAWTGTQLVFWGGQTPEGSRDLRDGVAYNPRTDRWSSLPYAPFRARGGSLVAWTGHALIVWGGEIGTPAGTNTAPEFPRDGAVFTPAAP